MPDLGFHRVIYALQLEGLHFLWQPKNGCWESWARLKGSGLTGCLLPQPVGEFSQSHFPSRKWFFYLDRLAEYTRLRDCPIRLPLPETSEELDFFCTVLRLLRSNEIDRFTPVILYPVTNSESWLKHILSIKEWRKSTQHGTEI